MPSTGYILAVLAITFAVTFALRAVPFAILKPLRSSRFVTTMAMWMPVGILGILAAATFKTAAFAGHGRVVHASVAAIVTAATHLLCGRRTLLSVGLGTLTFVVLVNIFA